MVLLRVLRRARRPSEEADVPNRDLDSPGQGRRDSPGQGRRPPRSLTNNGLGKGGYARKTPPGTRRTEGQRANETVAGTLAQQLVDLGGIVRAVQL